MFESVSTWFLSLGENYRVNPIIFGAIYVGAIPFFWLAIGWLVRNIRHKKSIVLPVMAMCSCAISSYIYLIIVGQNVPGWVYVFIAAMVLYGVYASLAKAREKMKEAAASASAE